MADVALAKKKSKGPEEWEVDSWARTLAEAEGIKNDPEKMKHVKGAINKKYQELGKVKVSLEDMKAKAADMPLDSKETCPECGMSMDDMSSEEMKSHMAGHGEKEKESKSHEKKKGDKKEDKAEGEKIS